MHFKNRYWVLPVSWENVYNVDETAIQENKFNSANAHWVFLVLISTKEIHKYVTSVPWVA